MPLELKLSPDAERNVTALETQWGRPRLYELVVKLFGREASRIAGRIARSTLSGQLLRRRSGELARSIVGLGVYVDGVPAARVGSLRGPATRYAPVQELGTKGANPNSPFPDIVPKRAKTLAVPVFGGRALTPAGVPRYAGPDGQSGPRQYPFPLRFVPVYRGNLVAKLYDERDLQPKRGSPGPVDLSKIKAVFLLLRKVMVRPKFFLRDGVQASIPDLLSSLTGTLANALAGGAATKEQA